MSITKKQALKREYYFLKLAILVAFSYWLLDSFIHYFWHGELGLELIPSDLNDLWMRISIAILLPVFGFIADYK